jgi:large repetitive protein
VHAAHGRHRRRLGALPLPKTYTGLARATYVLPVRGTDKAGNVSPVVTRTWTVETPPPDTTAPVVTVSPLGTLGSTATFVLTADEPGVTFQCQLTKDGKVIQAWAPCTCPQTYSGLKPGTYVLSVRGTDPSGNVSAVVTHSRSVNKGRTR